MANDECRIKAECRKTASTFDIRHSTFSIDEEHPMDMEKLVALCRRKGFIFQSSEIYGGIGGFWDYGPLGVELKKNVKDAWWQDMVRNPPPGPDGQEISMVGVDCSIIMNPQVWEASGHASGFADQMVDCKKCRKRYRADKVFVGGLCAESDLPPGAVVMNAQ